MGPQNKDHSILGSILESLGLWKALVCGVSAYGWAP